MTPARSPSDRRGGHPATTVAAWVLLALSAVACVLVTSRGLTFAHQMTCEPSPPPVAFRQTIVFVGLGLAVPCMLRAVVLVKRGRPTIALLLAGLALAISFFTFLIPIFVASMC